jgi:hypothetical protein
MPRPAPRVAPATTATRPASGDDCFFMRDMLIDDGTRSDDCARHAAMRPRECNHENTKARKTSFSNVTLRSSRFDDCARPDDCARHTAIVSTGMQPRKRESAKNTLFSCHAGSNRSVTARVTMTARRGHRVYGKCSHEASSARRMFVAFRQA